MPEIYLINGLNYDRDRRSRLYGDGDRRRYGDGDRCLYSRSRPLDLDRDLKCEVMTRKLWIIDLTV